MAMHDVKLNNKWSPFERHNLKLAERGEYMGSDDEEEKNTGESQSPQSNRYMMYALDTSQRQQKMLSVVTLAHSMRQH